MSKHIALRDKRVKFGGIPARPNLRIINTEATTPLGQVFSAIRAAAHGGRVKAMFVVCHGHTHSNLVDGVSMEGGGMGLALGKEGVFHNNVAQWSAIAGKVEHIVVYACSAAATAPGNEGTGADGKYLMGALAIHTKSTVWAADKNQKYTMHKDLDHGRFDMHGWEGQLWKFPPNGTGPAKVLRATVEWVSVFGEPDPR